MEWVRTNLASAQVSATIAVAEALERLMAQEPETSAWAKGYAAGWRHPSKDAAEEVAELTPTQTQEPF
jgi:phosphoribosylformylglycinamidine (FGAM) synthase-like enzyme